MDFAEHSFPLPQEQAHVLDEAKEEIEHQPALRRLALRVRANPWGFVALAAASGLLIGILVKARR
jgi:ElaB/YqjD/DUF883 family membrane-anchored ribosome-binding protein